MFVPYLERPLICDKVSLVSIVAEAEALFGISAKTIRRMIRSGKGPPLISSPVSLWNRSVVRYRDDDAYALLWFLASSNFAFIVVFL